MNFLHIPEALQERLKESAERNKIRTGRAPWAVRARMILEAALDKEETVLEYFKNGEKERNKK